MRASHSISPTDDEPEIRLREEVARGVLPPWEAAKGARQAGWQAGKGREEGGAIDQGMKGGRVKKGVANG